LLLIEIAMCITLGFILGVLLNKKLMLKRVRKAYSEGLSDGLDLKREGDVFVENIKEET
jgi:hypothetical protein